MSAKTGKRPLRSLSAHEKLEAIRRVHDGESKASVARDIGVPESTLRGWCKNEDKISFLSRQSSSPEADDVVAEPKEKRIKLDEAIQPFNLSLKHSTSLYPCTSQSLYTPLDYSKNDSDTAHKTPQNLCLKIETPKSSATATTSTTTTTTTTQMTEQELRRAELTRLSIELGLNRPEMFPTNLNNQTPTTTNTISDVTQSLTFMNTWNSILMQHQLIQNGQQTKKTTSEYLTLANSLIHSLPAISSTTKLQNSTRLSKEQQHQQQQQTTADDYIKSWLRIQEAAAVTAAVAANHANNSHNKTAQMGAHNISTTMVTTTTTTTPSVTTTISPTSIAATSSSSNNSTTTNFDAIYQNTLWKWSKELQQAQMNNLTINKQQQQIENNKPILYQQLTRDGNDISVAAKDTNNVINGKKMMKNGNKIRSILDNLLINNNHIDTNNKQNNIETISKDQALEHGEKFMQWLETNSDPMVTAIQLTQFKNLLNNVRLSANRQNGHTLRNKTKERRK